MNTGMANWQVFWQLIQINP